MQLLFGPQWEEHAKSVHEPMRIECLLDPPPPGSPCQNVNASLDDSSLVRSVRPATEAEQQRMEEVREMQALIRRRVGIGKWPSSDDRKAILTTLGADWVEWLPTYNIAHRTMVFPLVDTERA